MGIFSNIFKSLSELSKKELEKKKAEPKVQLNFEVVAWGEYLRNLEAVQKKYARDQWIDATYSKKPLYHYSWITDKTHCTLRPEPKNPYDEKAIAIYFDDLQIGYVPRSVNEKYYKKLLKNLLVKIEIHGGERKYKDDYGDLIKENGDIIAKVIWEPSS